MYFLKKRISILYLKIVGSLSRGKGYGQKHKFLKSTITKTESILKTDFAETWGGKIYVHSNDTGSLSTLSISGTFGPRDTQTMKDNVLPGNIVVDLGANIGYFTCLLAKLVGEDGKVFAFEPAASNYFCLCKNIELNKLDKQIFPLCVSFSDHTKIASLNMISTEYGSSQNEFDYKKGDTEGFVNYALSINKCVLAAIFIEDEKNKIIKISLRSKGDFSVNELSRKHFEGGGHNNAAGGKSNDSLEKTIERFISILPEYKTALQNEV